MTRKTRSRRIAAWTARLVAAIAIPVLVFVAWDQATYNFGQVQPGRIYRSGQMPATALAQTLRANRIKTVLNLRGSNPTEAWYPDEVAATNAAGATQVDIAMSSCVWMSRAQLRSVDPDARHRGIPDAHPLCMGIGAHRARLGVRRAAQARQHARRRPRPVLDPSLVRASQRR